MTDHHVSSFARRSIATGALALLAITSAPENVEAQIFNLGGFSNSRGYHQPAARRNMARHDSYLYAAVVEQSGKVIIRRKAEDVTSPWTTLAVSVNNSATGYNSTQPTTTVAMAVSRSGHLHITWGRYYYPSYFKQYYRCFKVSSSAFTHAPQDISALVGASAKRQALIFSWCPDNKVSGTVRPSHSCGRV